MAHSFVGTASTHSISSTLVQSHERILAFAYGATKDDIDLAGPGPDLPHLQHLCQQGDAFLGREIQAYMCHAYGGHFFL